MAPRKPPAKQRAGLRSSSRDSGGTPKLRDGASRVAKRPHTALKTAGSKPKSSRKNNKAIETALNQAPKDVLSVFVFGTGDCGELGLGPTITEALRPTLNPYLDPVKLNTFHVVQIACGGMHTVALTNDNKIITWGVNDHAALGRDVEWDGGFRDIDASDSDESGDLNPYESTPIAIPSECFPPGEIFTQVAAGDNCSFALTNNGKVYGWGTFRVSCI